MISQKTNSFKEGEAAKKERRNNLGLLTARIGIASLMLVHGLPKMMHLFSGDPVQFPTVIGMTAQMSLILAVLAEVFCSVMILVGFKTRLT